MNREDLLKNCRYYNGSIRFSGTSLSEYEYLENVYVDGGGELLPMHVEYESYGGKKFPGIPYELLIVMFTHWGKGEYDLKGNIESFYDYVAGFLSAANGHYREDVLPNS